MVQLHCTYQRVSENIHCMHTAQQLSLWLWNQLWCLWAGYGLNMTTLNWISVIHNGNISSWLDKPLNVTAVTLNRVHTDTIKWNSMTLKNFFKHFFSNSRTVFCSFFVARQTAIPPPPLPPSPKIKNSCPQRIIIKIKRIIIA